MSIRTITLASSLTVVALFAACSSQNEPPGGTSAAQSSDPDPAVASVCGTPSEAVCSDAQILAISITSDEGEVMLAKSVRDRLTTSSARDFADKMIADHTKMMEDAKKLADKLGVVPVQNGISKELADEAKMEMNALAKKSGIELDRSYIDHEVVDHVMDLGMGDHLLVPSARSSELKSSLLDDRTKIAEHYSLSIAVQTKIEGTCGGETPSGGQTDEPTE